MSTKLDRLAELAKEDGKRQFFSIAHLITPEALYAAFRGLRKNASAGIDGVTCEEYEKDAEGNIRQLYQRLKDGKYQAQPLRRVYIPKEDGKQRPISIPALEDKILQKAVGEVLNAIYEQDFLDCSYGFRLGRGAQQALDEMGRVICTRPTGWILEIDITAYFDSIVREQLMELVEKRISDGSVLQLIRKWIKVGVIEQGRLWVSETGTGQGQTISPLLANIYLHPFDELMASRGYRVVRYADDFVVMCKSREEAEAALEEIRRWVAENGLRLSPAKTHVGDCRQPGEGFEFLGYRFEAGRRWVRKKSLMRFKDRIREKTGRTRGDSLARVIADLNPMLRGWFGYFKHAHRHTFRALDQMIRRRLRAILRKQEKRPGVGLRRADHQRWPNTFFAEAGLLALEQAWQAARHSR